MTKILTCQTITEHVGTVYIIYVMNKHFSRILMPLIIPKETSTFKAMRQMQMVVLVFKLPLLVNRMELLRAVYILSVQKLFLKPSVINMFGAIK